MRRIREHAGEILRAGETAAVLGRGSTPSAEGTGGRGAIPCRAHGFQQQSQLPVIAVVIDVSQAVSAGAEHLVEPHLRGGKPLVLPLVDVERAQEQL